MQGPDVLLFWCALHSQPGLCTAQVHTSLLNSLCSKAGPGIAHILQMQKQTERGRVMEPEFCSYLLVCRGITILKGAQILSVQLGSFSHTCIAV